MNYNEIYYGTERTEDNSFDYYGTTGGQVRQIYYTEPPEEKKKKGKAKKILAAALSLAVVCGLLFSAFSDKNDSTVINKSNRTVSSVSYTSVTAGEAMSAAEVYAANVNSTVGITTSVNTNFFGYTTTSAAAGSGFIISADGYVVTNYHVIEEADTIKVTDYDGNTYEAELTGYDAENDIAVLKIDAEGLTPVTIGNSDLVSTGDEVVAIGNPLGELTFTITKGIISAKDREVTFSTGKSMKLIQTDCAINSGNSGGALFNMYGEVVGITNAKYSSSSSSEASVDNIGFAIPVNSVLDIIGNIIETGYTSDGESSENQTGGYPGYGKENTEDFFYGFGGFSRQGGQNYYYG